MFFGKETVHGRADDLLFVFDLEQLDRPVVAIGDHEVFRIEDENAVQGGIIDRVDEPFFLEDGLFVVPVDPYDGEGKEDGQQERKHEIAVIHLVEESRDMHLVMVFLRAPVEAEEDAGDRRPIGEEQLAEIAGEADDEGHDQEVGEEEQKLSRPESFHVVHHREVKIEVQHRYHACQQIAFAEIEVIGHDEDVGRAEIDERADIETEIEIRDDADEVSDEDQQDELIESYRLFPFGGGMLVL